MTKSFIINKMKSSFVSFTMLVMFSIFTTSLLAQSNNQGFFLDSWMPKTIEVTEFDSIAQTTESATVMVNIDAGQVKSKVSKYAFGHNAAFWGGKIEQNRTAITNITNLNPNLIRWPGGSLSNEYFWNATGKSTCPDDLPADFNFRAHNYGSNESTWTMSLNSFYKTLKATGDEGIISVNYAYARYGTSEDPVLTAAKHAADWVRYDNGRTRYWEIGNENYGNWEIGYEIDTELNKDGQPKIITGALYGKHCNVFISEMKKAALEVGNDIKIGVVVYNSNNVDFAAVKEWNKGVMTEVAEAADFLAVHKYFGNKTDTDASVILNTAGTEVKKTMAMLNAELKSYTDIESLPIALTEYNIWPKGQMQQVSYVTGMHNASVMGSLISNNIGAGNRWDFMNGWSDGDNHGLFADGEPGIERYTPRAPFFYLYYMQKYFGDRAIANQVIDNTNFDCYSSSFSSGQVGIVLINKSKVDEVVNIKLDNFKLGDKYYYYLLKGDNDNNDFSRKVLVNGVTSDEDGGGPANYSTLKPYGTIISGELNLEIPKLGTLIILVENDKALPTQNINFNELEDKILGDDDFTPKATSSSGLPVEFASSNSNVVIIQKGMVHISGAGTCDIVAFQDGNESYLPANKIVQKLTVSKGTQEISFPELPIKYTSDKAFSPDAIASSGAECTYTSSNLDVAKIENGLIHIVAEGTTEITAKQTGNRNYDAAPDVSRTLQVDIKTNNEEWSKSKPFEIFPNPANNYVRIKFSVQSQTIRIYNSVGSLVYEKTSESSELIIPTSKLGGKGVFFIQYNSSVQKLIIQ